MLHFCPQSFVINTTVARWMNARYHATMSMQFCSDFVFKDAFASNPLFLPFMMDRYCHSQDFWIKVTRQMPKKMDIFVFMHKDDSDAAYIFAQHHPIPFSSKLLKYCLSMPTDETLWSICAHNRKFNEIFMHPAGNSHEFIDNWLDKPTTIPLLDSITRWKSHRLVQLLMQNGFFAHKEQMCFFLHYLAMYESSWTMFENIWTVHFNDTFLPKYHNTILEAVMKHSNGKAFHFLARLADFHISDDIMMIFMRQRTFNADMHALVLQHKTKT